MIDALTFTRDRREVEAHPGETIWQVARCEPALSNMRGYPVALMLGQLYDALRAGNVPDDKARAAAEEVSKLRLDVSERLNRIDGELRLHRWMIGFLIAVVLGMSALEWQILLRLPS